MDTYFLQKSKIGQTAYSEGNFSLSVRPEVENEGSR